MRSFGIFQCILSSLTLPSLFLFLLVNVRPPLEGALRVFRIANASKEGVPCRHVQPIGKVVEPVSSHYFDIHIFLTI